MERWNNRRSETTRILPRGERVVGNDAVGTTAQQLHLPVNLSKQRCRIRHWHAGLPLSSGSSPMCSRFFFQTSLPVFLSSRHNKLKVRTVASSKSGGSIDNRRASGTMAMVVLQLLRLPDYRPIGFQTGSSMSTEVKIHAIAFRSMGLAMHDRF